MNLSLVHSIIKVYLKPLFIWLFILTVSAEVILHFKLSSLPYKFLNHTSGPIQLLGQYSKQKVIPSNYLAMVGDSNVYGFGPWLYDNSWSMKQPSFATQHLLHKALQKDVVAFGYPGFGNMGSALTSIAEHKFIHDSPIWPSLEYPKRILFVFYEGNDLINNLHEVQQRGLNIGTSSNLDFEAELNRVFKQESTRLDSQWTFLDHSAAWNLLFGISSNYYNRFASRNKQRAHERSYQEVDLKPQNDNIKKIDENIAIIAGKKIDIGFSEGPALLLHQNEISLSLYVLKRALMALKKYFHASQIDLIYLPSSLSLYKFDDCLIRPAPLSLNGEERNNVFRPIDAQKNHNLIISEIHKITQSLGIGFFDSTVHLKEAARSNLLHGPRDPIHLNRKGYECFADAIVQYF